MTIPSNTNADAALFGNRFVTQEVPSRQFPDDGMPAADAMRRLGDKIGSKLIAEQVGRLLDALDARGLRDNTLVIFTSDNGLLWGEHRWVKKEVPYEEAIRVPMLIRGPGIAAGTRVADPVADVDLRLQSTAEDIGTGIERNLASWPFSTEPVSFEDIVPTLGSFASRGQLIQIWKYM
jgi:hypothetical protein